MKKKAGTYKMVDELNKDIKKLTAKSPTFSMEVIEKPKTEFTKEQWNLRRFIDNKLTSSGYDHYMGLQEWEDMLDEIMFAIENEKKEIRVGRQVKYNDELGLVKEQAGADVLVRKCCGAWRGWPRKDCEVVE